MLKTPKLNYFNFDMVKALASTIAITIPVAYGIHVDNFSTGFSFALGGFFAMLPNTDGTHRHRIFGMFLGLLLALLTTFILHFAFLLPSALFYPILFMVIFAISMLSVFGFRASMLALAGLMAVVMSFSVRRFGFDITRVMVLISLGGIGYIFVAGLIHAFFYKKTTSITLAEAVELTAKYLDIRHRLNWHLDGNETELRSKLLKTEVQLNEKHELLRELLIEKRSNSGQSNKTSRFLLIFLEMLDLYELAIANNFETQEFDEHFNGQLSALSAFRDWDKQQIEALFHLATALQKNIDLPNNLNPDNYIRACEASIENWVKTIGLPKARPAALFLRNLVDYYQKQTEKINTSAGVYLQYLAGEDSQTVKNVSPRFLPSNDYQFKTLIDNLSFESSTFKHALRIASAMLLGLAAGNQLVHQNSYWILLTIVVILRPNYALTKSRAAQRILGTLLGAAIGAGILLLTTNQNLYGIVAVISLLFGFAFIQKNYRIAATYITLSIILLYGIMVDNTWEMIKFRILDTTIGAVISLMAVYLMWPSWEYRNIKTVINDTLEGLTAYLEDISRIYISKDTADSQYRLSRKKAFLNTSNLSAAFQRLTEEPKSKRDHLSQIYAVVVICQTILSALAALGTFIQNHSTTPASAEFTILINGILKNLQNALKSTTIDAEYDAASANEIDKATQSLEERLTNLDALRNKELAAGIVPMQLAFREQMKEGLLITNQLKWLYGLSENLVQTLKNI